MNKNFKDAIIDNKNGAIIKIEVIPKSSKSEIFTYNEWRNCITIKIKEHPSDNKANKKLIKLFSKIFENPNISIISGEKSRNKKILINEKKEMVIKKFERLLK